ncbi:transcription factor bHLH118-like [Olea europaea subsp. europaea]|uniref:Transcription factor bHLH118-like n=1 Tax=Olea europaea subsp. europaea TaxID=158383 RepID=A0A8S0TXD7_OLEEU|nr:transcription factor bHLH118-like [Olea europaea subsp. europaea]
MFPFQHGDELGFQPPPVIKEDQVLEDLHVGHTLPYNSNPCTSSLKRGLPRSSGIQENNGGSTSDIRKLLRRDIERQRRQEMTNLYASLQSLVTPQYLQGKKSTSDLIQEAANYVTDTKKNIEKLGLQRDKLKMLFNSGNLCADVGSSSSYSPDLVTVNSCIDGVEILISSFKEEGFLLSKVLTELLGRGLNVTSCASTKENERSLHRIMCEHGDELGFQPPPVIKEDQVLEDLHVGHTLPYDSNPCTSSLKRGLPRSSGIQENNGGSTSDIRKLLRRDIEQQRRQEMANLYASLQSLVPPQYLQSTSDLIQEAANYVIDTKKNIKKLGNLCADVGSSSSYSPDLVTVNSCLDGVEILISSFKEEGFLLSKVLTELLGRGLNVTSCASTKENERSLHRIMCETSDLSCNDLSTLQERLSYVINLCHETS